MRSNLVGGLFVLTVILTEVSGEMVNLTRQAENYIKRLNQSSGNITDWGLTEDYSFWDTSQEDRPNVSPITVKVADVTCHPAPLEYERLDSNFGVKRIVYVWNITSRIWSPFKLNINVRILLAAGHEFKKQNFQFSVTTKPVIKATPPGKTPKYNRIYIERCKLKAQVIFDGFFAYQSKSRERNVTKYHTVHVGMLSNDSKRIVTENTYQQKLTYTLDGWHMRRVLLSDSGSHKLIMIA
uniref:Dermacentor immunosuppressive protein Da-p36-like protein n=1 Tax=Amblyomma variegatum TaxID=34610 RepID=F0J9R8_AMBVA|nr:TPA_inf: dermacentor immunosuppressive protein Da-p36-like protein [Amblyomma variegatum]